MKNTPMILQNIRVRGLGDVVDSAWLDIDRNLTIFSLPYDFNRRGFLQALQTIHPPYSCRRRDPFREYPRISRQGKYQKRVRPHRRTIAFAIFIARPNLVMDLAGITPDLYETDRIEVGRRLDYSRWINFVEIAGSSRWSEVHKDIEEIADLYPQSVTASLKRTIFSLEKTDRIVDETRKILTGWISLLLETEEEWERRGLLERALFVLQRQVHFKKAKEAVQEYLPIFHVVDGSMLGSYGSSCRNSGEAISCIADRINELRRCELNKRRIQPLLLFDEPDLLLDAKGKESLREIVSNISSEIQCLYLISEEEGWNVNREDRIITVADMLR